MTFEVVEATPPLDVAEYLPAPLVVLTRAKAAAAFSNGS